MVRQCLSIGEVARLDRFVKSDNHFGRAECKRRPKMRCQIHIAKPRIKGAVGSTDWDPVQTRVAYRYRLHDDRLALNRREERALEGKDPAAIAAGAFRKDDQTFGFIEPAPDRVDLLARIRGVPVDENRPANPGQEPENRPARHIRLGDEAGWDKGSKRYDVEIRDMIAHEQRCPGGGWPTYTSDPQSEDMGRAPVVEARNCPGQ